MIGLKKKIVFLAGDPGTGKTTLAKEFLKNHAGIILDKDTICDRFTHFLGDLMNLDPKHSEFYQEHVRDLEYNVMEDIFLENIIHSDIIFLVAPYGKEIKENNQYFKNLIKKIKQSGIEDFDLFVFVIECSPEENKARIVLRNKKDDVYKINNWNEYAKERKIGENKNYNKYVKKMFNSDMKESINFLEKALFN